jgi:peptidoglycan/xylan/chitin deacetylase (PgdA/CDA1 family)
VLAYHKVTRFELGGTWVPPRRFTAHIDAVLGAGYRFIDEDGFISAIKGERICAAKEVLLTFDDGYEELLDTALPELEQRGIPALIFLVSSFVGKDNRWELFWPGRRFRHLDWREIGKLAAMGFSFGSHTRTHRDLTRLSIEVVREELAVSRLEIEQRLGCEVKSLSYPFGRTNTAVSAAAAAAGYRAAFTMYPRHPNRSIDLFELRREGVYIVDTSASIRSKLGGGPFFWMEDLKGRAINKFAVLTPMLKGMRSPGRGR